MQKVVLDMWIIKNSTILFEIRYIGIIQDGFIYAKCHSITSVTDSNYIKVPLQFVNPMQPLNKDIAYYTMRINIDEEDPFKNVDHSIPLEVEKTVLHSFYEVQPYLPKLKRKLF